jgi:hypothetical protein
MTTVNADPSWDLPTLNTFVAQQENTLAGPLTGIGNSGGQTTLEIDVMGGIPSKNAVVITTGAPPAGSTQIGIGKIYVSGTLTDGTAYRPA